MRIEKQVSHHNSAGYLFYQNCSIFLSLARGFLDTSVSRQAPIVNLHYRSDHSIFLKADRADKIEESSDLSSGWVPVTNGLVRPEGK